MAPLAMHLAAIREIYDVRPGDRELMFFSMNFDAAAEQWMTPLCEGAAIVLSTTHGLGRSDSFASLIDGASNHNAALASGLFAFAPPNDATDGASVRTCIAGAKHGLPQILRLPRRRFPTFALSTPMAQLKQSSHPPAWIGSASPEYLMKGEYAPDRRSCWRAQLYVLDSELNLVPPGAGRTLYRRLGVGARLSQSPGPDG